ncbi:hypothetical protein LFL96_31895 [Paraburkholderia sp. D15]|uniref:hypothetical protein n=1 Tax=Paraburkholderia sp. D15 TaxID=2880218 RepID=UPI00247845A7|nr:hypothetical protein [Paraburkholderia sp. D15]WGS52785.1 hypothetical protein LFL96_31895 [Paraburkholderia sp. D15]
MLFATHPNRSARCRDARAAHAAADGERRQGQDAARGRVRRSSAGTALSGSSNLDGWKAYAAPSFESGNARRHDAVEVSNLRDAAQQIAELRAQLRDKQAEIDVLAEAVEYARGFCTEC